MKLSELLPVAHLQRLCEEFTTLTGAVTAVLDLEGNILVATGWQDICTRFHRVHPGTASRCHESDTELAASLDQGLPYKVYKCRNGLVDAAMPIVVGGQHVGNFFTGQFFFEKPDADAFLAQARQFGFPSEVYLAALKRVPVLSEDRVRLMMGFFTLVTNMIASMGIANEELRVRGEELGRANATLAAEVAERKRAEEELQRAHDELEERVFERTRSLREALAKLERQQDELRVAKEAAESANRAKSDFLSSMSHELRTPLNAILGFAQILDSAISAPLDDKQRFRVQQIMKGGNHLLSLINEVLDLARIESGVLTMSVEPIETKALMAEVLELTRAFTTHGNTTVQDWTVADDVAGRVRADYMRLKQVLLNLTSNAVKYNRPGGTVHLAAEAGSGHSVRFVVTDDGPGIPPEKHSLIFQPFNRLGAETTEIEGTGVGLTITKRMVEAMDGRIGFETEVGRGTTFWVEVPASEDSLAAPPEAVEDDARDAMRAAAAGAPRRLLYVEDNPVNLQLMRDLLSEVPDFILASAPTAEVGIEMAVATQPDVIVLDVNLPGMNGIEALGQLKTNPRTSHIPVIALSANVNPSVIRRGLEAGFLHYLAKPLDIGLFLRIVVEMCSKPGIR
ncbi:PocR ligand-binding domain-containing protein [Azospirillum isscasi]|uniref:histidine kinase n=1 Tax=Azospirillum isscasi TaxID=3053926 RepID=A0ABU0WGQ4_9PROT|nr:PocR ligand-binding domain-containing protein [Azospirillum isscasi]MDQ2103385.1 PocR ligand-binding domain-containing protein [Azospirillum isscasi]